MCDVEELDDIISYKQPLTHKTDKHVHTRLLIERTLGLVRNRFHCKVTNMPEQACASVDDDVSRKMFVVVALFDDEHRVTFTFLQFP